VVRPWPRLPREAVAAPPPRAQGQVGRIFEQPGLVEGVPAPGRGAWNKMIFEVPSNPSHSMILFDDILGAILVHLPYKSNNRQA